MSICWATARDGLALGDILTISFQRYLVGGRGPIDSVPTSLGALQPCADPDGTFLVPVHPGEAVWIGILTSAPWPRIRGVVRHRGRCRDLTDGRPLSLAAARSISGSPLAILPGLPLEDGRFLPFVPVRGAGGRGLQFEFEAVAADGVAVSPPARARLIDPAGFTARTGCPAPPPATAGNGYRGWRLP